MALHLQPSGSQVIMIIKCHGGGPHTWDSPRSSLLHEKGTHQLDQWLPHIKSASRPTPKDREHLTKLHYFLHAYLHMAALANAIDNSSNNSTHCMTLAEAVAAMCCRVCKPAKSCRAHSLSLAYNKHLSIFGARFFWSLTLQIHLGGNRGVHRMGGEEGKRPAPTGLLSGNAISGPVFAGPMTQYSSRRSQ